MHRSDECQSLAMVPSVVAGDLTEFRSVAQPRCCNVPFSVRSVSKRRPTLLDIVIDKGLSIKYKTLVLRFARIARNELGMAVSLPSETRFSRPTAICRSPGPLWIDKRGFPALRLRAKKIK